MMEQQFDVFLAHSSKDKPLIRQIYRQLRARGIRPWLDEEEIPPGTKFQDEIQQAIGQIKTAAICIGQNDLGPWQALELKTFISQCVRRDIPVIPVLLPGVEAIPENLLFLSEFHGVFFRNGIDDERAFFQLEWGITGRKPRIDATSVMLEPSEPVSSLPTEDADPADNLASEKGIDYGRLRDLLKAQNFKDADYETYLRMLEAVGRKKGDWIRDKELLNFPCADLKTIDRLWVKYSDGKFGFSVQKKIYVQCGAKLEASIQGDKIWEKFGDRVRWRVNNSWIYYKDVTFSTSAPQGHLPIPVGSFNGWSLGLLVSSLALALVKCKV
ncbi:MAG: GUN4 domain-containing protein [Synechococcales bacterium]|nr:GUN4 domain-containing protein [Synechococcales bacterium]